MFKACKAELVPTKQAALELGVSTATLRSWMKHQHINIGVYDKKMVVQGLLAIYTGLC